MDFIDLFLKAKTRRIGPGHVLFKEGDVGTEMFVVIEGAVSIAIGGTVVEVARPGSVVGEMALVDDERRSATAVTRTGCELVALSKGDFDRLIHERPDFARHVLKIVVQRLRRMDRSMQAEQSGSAPGRKADFSLARTNGDAAILPDEKPAGA